jgi:hypothetical protein
MCAVLNTIDQTGFLNLAPQEWMWNTYHAQSDGYSVGEGAPSTYIDVQGWITQTIKFYELYEVLNALKDEPDTIKDRYVPKAIRDVDSLLAHLSAQTLKPYVPNRLVLVVTSYGPQIFTQPSPRWPLSLRLSTLVSPTLVNEDQVVPQVMEGPQVTQLYERYFRQTSGYDAVDFMEGDVTYSVLAFPLYPYESFNGRAKFNPKIPSPDVPFTTTAMTCRPSDGVLPIP